MALLITAIIYSMSWGITFFNNNIIHYRSLTNGILSKYNKFNKILNWLNLFLFIIAVIAFIFEFAVHAHSKAFLVFLSEFVILTLFFAPLTTLSFEYLYNKVFAYINRVYVIINALFVLTYILYPFFIIKILDVNDQTKIMISQIFLTIELYLFLALIIYMIFMVYQTSTLSHKVLLVENYLKDHLNYKLPNDLKAKKYHWLVPTIFSKALLKDALHSQKVYELVLTKYRYLPHIKTGSALSQKKAKQDKKTLDKKKRKVLKQRRKK